MSIEKLKTEVFRLSPGARARLARELLASLEGMTQAEIDELWTEEAIRRDEELDTGAARAVPADEVLSRARVRR